MAKETSDVNNKLRELSKKLTEFKIKPTVSLNTFADTIVKINPNALIPIPRLSEEIRSSLKTLNDQTKRFHGAKISLSWFPGRLVFSRCSDKFGYLTSSTVRTSSKLEFDTVNQSLLDQLGNMMGDPGRESGPDSTIPSGYTYLGQFIDHDITLDVSSTLDTAVNARSINNMRTPSLELDNLYAGGPALNPYLFDFPTSGPMTAIKFKLGTNKSPLPPANPAGGPSTGGVGGMQVQNDYDIPRISGTNTAVIGDPRNDENLIVSQFHSAMLKFHNAVVDLLVTAAFTGDIFVEAKRIVTHHYQWSVVNDYLKQICGSTAVTNALSSVTITIGGAFRMPVEFSVAAFRFGHSQIRNSYWINHTFINQSLADVFAFNRNPNLPVLSNWVIDFNAFFKTGVPVPVFNNARKIDSVLANGLESIPGGSGIMANLATRNLRRGLALGLPSGQATATALELTPMSSGEITSGLPPAETTLLNQNGGVLLAKTPLWYYILREAAVLGGGNSLGPVGAKIVAETFIKMLKRDKNSYLNTPAFAPILPSKIAGDFTIADMMIFAGVTKP